MTRREVMRPEQKRIAALRKPLEQRKASLLIELAEVKALLRELGVPSTANAAVRYIAEHPGALTPEIVRETGVCPTRLSHLAQAGVLENDGATGRSYHAKHGNYARWWIAGERK